MKLKESLNIGSKVKFIPAMLWMMEDEGDEITYFNFDTDSEELLPEIYYDAIWNLDEIDEDRAFISISSSDPEMSKYSVWVPLEYLTKYELPEMTPEGEEMARNILKHKGKIKENYETGPRVLIDTENKEVWGIIKKKKDAYRIDNALDEYEMRSHVSLLDIADVKNPC
jgi:hypothetical protein